MELGKVLLRRNGINALAAGKNHKIINSHSFLADPQMTGPHVLRHTCGNLHRPTGITADMSCVHCICQLSVVSVGLSDPRLVLD